MPRLLPLGLLLCLGIGGLCTARAQTEPEVAVWKKLSLYLTEEAARMLEELPETTTPEAQREREFCATVVHLDRQPLSESRLDVVERRLQALLAVESNDEIGRASRYVLGRIAQLYRTQPDVAKAADYYRGLVRQSGSDTWGAQARMKLALLTLYVLPAPTPDERIAEVADFLAEADDPMVVRDLHRLLARAILFYNLPPRQALDHLLQADEIGGLSGTQGADQLVQIGELAWDEGKKEMAIHFYERLQKEYPRDPRIFVMNERLAGRPTPDRGEVIHGR